MRYHGRPRCHVPLFPRQREFLGEKLTRALGLSLSQYVRPTRALDFTRGYSDLARGKSRAGSLGRIKVNNMNLSNISINLHSSIRITGSKTVYFDPFKHEDAPHDADIVFVTHEHYDHFDPASIEKVAKKGTVVVAPKSMRALIEKEACVTESILLAPGEKAIVLGVPVEAVPAYNVKPERSKFHPGSSAWNGYVVTLDGARYYVAGDTDENEDNKKVKCDVALIPSGDTYTFNSKEAAEFALHLNPKAAIPTHYGSVVGKPGDGADFKRFVEASGTDIQVELKI